MGGFLGLGHSSEKTDRGAQLGARQGLWNIFNWALPAGKEATGQAQGYWSKLLQPGRTGAAMLAAPATNAVQAQADTARREEAAMGTSRGGGTAAINRESGVAAQKTVDDIINQTLMGGRTEAARGLGGMGESLLGLAGGSIEDILSNATQSRVISHQINRDVQKQWGSTIGALIEAGMAFGGGGGGGATVV